MRRACKQSIAARPARTFRNPSPLQSVHLLGSHHTGQQYLAQPTKTCRPPFAPLATGSADLRAHKAGQPGRAATGGPDEATQRLGARAN